MATKKKGGAGKTLAVGAGVAAVGAAAYMLLGPKGKQNRAKVKAFAKKAKNAMTKNKDMVAMANAAKKMMLGAKTKAKGAMTKGKTIAKSAVKKGMSSAKKVVKKGVAKAKKKIA